MQADKPSHDPRPLEQAIHAAEVTPVSKGADSELESSPRATAIVIAALVAVCAALAYLSTLIA